MNRNSSLIQQINHKIQIPGVSHPHEIWDLKVGRSGVEFAELEYHFQDAGPENRKPDKCKQESTHVKEDDRPQEVKDQLERVVEQGIENIVRVCSFQQEDSGTADTHQYVEECPYDRK